MAEQDTEITAQCMADFKKGESETTTEQEESVSAQNVKEEHSKATDSAPPSTAANREAISSNTQDMKHIEVKDIVLRSAEESVSPVVDSKSNCTAPQDNERSHGDNSEETPGNNKPTVKPDEFSKEDKNEEEAPETSPSLIACDRNDDLLDGPKAGLIEDPSATNTGEEEEERFTFKCDGRGEEKVLGLEKEEDVKDVTTSPVKPPQKHPVETEIAEKTSDDVETLGFITEETTEPTIPEDTRIPRGNAISWLAVGIVVLFGILLHHVLYSESPAEKKDVQQIDIFRRELEMVKTQFPNQRSELWRRSKIALERHLKTAQPTEPVSLILTAGRRAERTLHCLAKGLASAFSSALNASVLHIDGASKASQDSDQVKMDIDSQLQGAFAGDKPVAVIHRFEELPPGSTLIFYRYCDHENAAYKRVFLAFTVLLPQEEVEGQQSLKDVEEMVQDYIKEKFVGSIRQTAFNRMDIDKYSGLWSRISHLILPVVVERIEHQGC